MWLEITVEARGVKHVKHVSHGSPANTLQNEE
jgi:hypothetical protein